MLDNLATDPQGTITSIRGSGKFSNERMARLTFVRTQTRPTVDADADDETFTVALGSLPSSVGAGRPSSIEVTIRDDDPPERPGPPAVTPGDGTLDVSWTAVPGAESYTVQWKSAMEEYSDARQQTVQAPSATLSGLTNGVAYAVRVRASNAGGDSAWSEEATGTPLQPVPALPAAGVGLLGLLLALLGGGRRTPGGV